jgi:hypothetical protein
VPQAHCFGRADRGSDPSKERFLFASGTNTLATAGRIGLEVKGRPRGAPRPPFLEEQDQQDDDEDDYE